jgi:hypothetical protein
VPVRIPDHDPAFHCAEFGRGLSRAFGAYQVHHGLAVAQIVISSPSRTFCTNWLSLSRASPTLMFINVWNSLPPL